MWEYPPGFPPLLGAGNLQRLLSVGHHGQRLHGPELDDGAVLVLEHQVVLVEHHVGQVGQLQGVLVVAEVAAVGCLLWAALGGAQLAAALQDVRFLVADGPAVELDRLSVHRQPGHKALLAEIGLSV